MTANHHLPLDADGADHGWSSATLMPPLMHWSNDHDFCPTHSPGRTRRACRRLLRRQRPRLCTTVWRLGATRAKALGRNKPLRSNGADRGWHTGLQHYPNNLASTLISLASALYSEATPPGHRFQRQVDPDTMFTTEMTLISVLWRSHSFRSPVIKASHGVERSSNNAPASSGA
jgi:hypothetical protein